MAYGSPSRKRGLISFCECDRIDPERFVADEEKKVGREPSEFLVETTAVNIAQLGDNGERLLAGNVTDGNLVGARRGARGERWLPFLSLGAGGG